MLDFIERIRTTREGTLLEVQLPDPTTGGLTRFDLERLTLALNTASHDPSIGAVLLTGGTVRFCDGLAIEEFTEAEWLGDLAEALRGCFKAFAQLEVPLIAAVSGNATGFGMTMLLHADAVVIADTAVLRAPFVDLGLVPEAGATFLAAPRMGYLDAVRLFCLGEAVPAEEARFLGLVSDVVPAQLVAATARKKAAQFARRSDGTLRRTRALLKGQLRPLLQRIDLEVDVSHDRLRNPTLRTRLGKLAAFARRS